VEGGRPPAAPAGDLIALGLEVDVDEHGIHLDALLAGVGGELLGLQLLAEHVVDQRLVVAAGEQQPPPAQIPGGHRHGRQCSYVQGPQRSRTVNRSVCTVPL
jgi:hypothetical protein